MQRGEGRTGVEAATCTGRSSGQARTAAPLVTCRTAQVPSLTLSHAALRNPATPPRAGALPGHRRRQRQRQDCLLQRQQGVCPRGDFRHREFCLLRSSRRWACRQRHVAACAGARAAWPYTQPASGGGGHGGRAGRPASACARLHQQVPLPPRHLANAHPTVVFPPCRCCAS